MKDVLMDDGFIGSVHFSAEDGCFFGRIEGVDDLVTFEGADVKSLTEAFLQAVGDYKVLCRAAGKPIHKSYKGSFNVRITPGLHKKAVQKSLLLGISLNQLVRKAIEKEVGPDESPRR